MGRNRRLSRERWRASPMASFAPLHPVNGYLGYLPLEDYGLIGDGSAAALVGRDGAIPWLCVPRFDAPPLFCGLLDAGRGGAFTVAPEDLVESRQCYAPDSGVLVTDMRGRSGRLRLTDALVLRSGADLTEDAPAGRAELLRSVRVLHGRVRLRVEVSPRGGARAEPQAGGLRLRCPGRPDLDLQLFSTVPLDGLSTTHTLDAGDRLHLILRWGRGTHRHHPFPPEALLRTTLDTW